MFWGEQIILANESHCSICIYVYTWAPASWELPRPTSLDTLVSAKIWNRIIDQLRRPADLPSFIFKYRKGKVWGSTEMFCASLDFSVYTNSTDVRRSVDFRSKNREGGYPVENFFICRMSSTMVPNLYNAVSVAMIFLGGPPNSQGGWPRLLTFFQNYYYIFNCQCHYHF